MIVCILWLIFLGHLLTFHFCCIKDTHSFFSFCLFLGLHPWHMEVPRLGVQSELQLLAYARATAMPYLSLVCDLQHSSQQHWILNPLNGARDRTLKLMVPSWIHSRCTMVGTPTFLFFNPFSFLVAPAAHGSSQTGG